MGWQTSDTAIFKQLCKTYTYLNPIRILAEGDSWFGCSRHFLRADQEAGIIDHLADMDNLLILNPPSNGDELLDMVSGERKLSFLKRLHYMDFDLVLLSGGGNDFVGRYDFGFMLYEKTPGMEWRECINTTRLFIKIRQVEFAYRELIERIIDFQPRMRIVMHTYDFPIPSNEDYELFEVIPNGRSWIYPCFMQKNISDPEDQRKIIRNMLLRLKSSLYKIEKDYAENVTVVNTQGLLQERHWRNEIHPSSQGSASWPRKYILKALSAEKLNK